MTAESNMGRWSGELRGGEWIHQVLRDASFALELGKQGQCGQSLRIGGFLPQVVKLDQMQLDALTLIWQARQSPFKVLDDLRLDRATEHVELDELIAAAG